MLHSSEGARTRQSLAKHGQAFLKDPRTWRVGGRLTASSAALSLLQRDRIHRPGETNSQPVSEMFLSSPWRLAGLAHSEVTGLVGLGRQGFGMQLDCTGGLPPQLCKAEAEAMGVPCPSC